MQDIRDSLLRRNLSGCYRCRIKSAVAECMNSLKVKYFISVFLQ
nr:MAG TPA: hypothetical protein [Caudoviricetes sp.]